MTYRFVSATLYYGPSAYPINGDDAKRRFGAINPEAPDALPKIAALLSFYCGKTLTPRAVEARLTMEKSDAMDIAGTHFPPTICYGGDGFCVTYYGNE